MIIISPDKFKFSLTSFEVASAMRTAVSELFPEQKSDILLLSDGGEGTSRILSEYYKAKEIKTCVKNAVFEPVNNVYFYSEIHKTAFINFAQAAGLENLKNEYRNPMNTSSFGVGEMILDAIKIGAGTIYLCLGGSATNDAGIGLAAALGYKFYDKDGFEIEPTGKNLINIKKIDDKNLKFDKKTIKFVVLCDVRNTLYGENGAAKVYAKQKGANDFEIEILEQGLRNFAEIVKSQFDIDFSDKEFAGAAGGAGAGAFVFLGAQLKSGIEELIRISDFEKRAKEAKVIITGEGKVDKQTLSGKLIKGISDISKRTGTKLCAVCGSNELSEADLQSLNISIIKSLSENSSDIELDKNKSKKKVYLKTLELLDCLEL